MKLSEIDKEIARLQGLRAEAEKAEAAAAVQKNYEEAVKVTARLIEDVRRLDEIGYLPPKIRVALTDGNDKFNPGMYIKKPKAPR